MKRILLSLALLWLAAGSSSAQAPATLVTFDSAKVTVGDALPGSNVVVTVSFKVQGTHYIYSNRPTTPRATPTQIQIGALGGTRALPAAFSAPAQKTIPGNAVQASVYEGGFTAQVPVVIAPNAAFPIKLPGIVAYQPVDAKTHVPSRFEQARFEINIPRATNTPPANAKSPSPDPKKK